MELRKGYKESEAGVIPIDWNAKTIGETLKIKHGKNQKEVQSENGIYPILGTGGLMGYANRFLYDKESVLIGRKGTIDKPKYMNSPFWTVDTLFYSEVNTNYLAKYIYYNFLLIDWYAYNEASGVPSLNAKTIENIYIPLPPTKAEQTAITTALTDADALISSLEKLIEKKRNIKQGAMQQLLKPKKGWVVKKIKYLSDYIAVGFVGSMSNLFTYEGIPLLRGLNILPGSLDMSILKYISIETHKNWKKSNLIPGDLVMVRVGYPGTATVIPEGLGNLNAASLVIVRPNKNIIDANYLCYYINSYRGKLEIQNMLVGGAQQVFNTGTAAELEIPVPQTKTEQTEIATVLSDIDNEISSLEKELSKIKMLKQGMMQELLTGKIRLV